jgi:hypothetical protein
MHLIDQLNWRLRAMRTVVDKRRRTGDEEDDSKDDANNSHDEVGAASRAALWAQSPDHECLSPESR